MRKCITDPQPLPATSVRPRATILGPNISRRPVIKVGGWKPAWDSSAFHEDALSIKMESSPDSSIW